MLLSQRFVNVYVGPLALWTVSVLPARAAPAPVTRSLGYEMTVQRAAEAAIWGIPAVSLYDIELSIQRDLDGEFGDVAYFSRPMTSRHGSLTANDVTPYAVGALSCKDDPLVIEVPPAGDKASFFGTIVDAWQTPLADVGPPGLESNWIPTGEDFFLLFRLYGPDQPLFDQSWKLADVERVDSGPVE